MKVKFNVMDVIIVLILLAVIGAGLLLLGGGSEAGAAEIRTIQLQVELAKQEEAFTKLPQVGDKAAIGVKEKMDVTVTKVEVKPATASSEDVLGGTRPIVEIEGRYDVLITLEGEGVETDAAVKINDVAARVGDEAVIKSKNWAGVGVFLGVEVL